MPKLQNVIQNANSLEAYELNILAQLNIIKNIKASKARLAAIPTSSFYQLMGSRSEMERDLEAERDILKSLEIMLESTIAQQALII